MITIRCPTPDDCSGAPCLCYAAVTDDDGQDICFEKYLPDGRIRSHKICFAGGTAISETLRIPVSSSAITAALAKNAEGK